MNLKIRIVLFLTFDSKTTETPKQFHGRFHSSLALIYTTKLRCLLQKNLGTLGLGIHQKGEDIAMQLTSGLLKQTKRLQSHLRKLSLFVVLIEIITFKILEKIKPINRTGLFKQNWYVYCVIVGKNEYSSNFISKEIIPLNYLPGREVNHFCVICESQQKYKQSIVLPKMRKI